MQEIKVFVGSTFIKYMSDFTEGIKESELDGLAEPGAPNPGDQVAFEVWKVDYREYQVKTQEYANFRSSLYSLVM